MFENWISVLAAVASLVSFAIQLLDLMPRLGDRRKVLTAALVGVFVGSLLRSFDTAQISFALELTGPIVLSAIIAFFLFVLAVKAFNTDEALLRGEVWSVFVALSVLFVAVLFVAGISGMDRRIRPVRTSISIQEYRLLSDNASKSGDYARAISHLNSISFKMGSTDSRQDSLQSLIEDYKRKELGIAE